MPIETFIRDGKAYVSQTFDRPTVYFDHWAVCEFSDDLIIQNRFVEALKAKNGTFILSSVNICEFVNASDPRHAASTESFLQRLMPNIYFITPDFEKLPPQPDFETLEFVTSYNAFPNESIILKNFIMIAHEYRDELSAIFNQSNQEILDILVQQKSNPEFIKKARQSLPDNNRVKHKMIMGELMRELVLDPNVNITTNDVVDLQHATLAISCCDYVLLDGPWLQRTKAMFKRVDKQNLCIDMAKCFSKRECGIENFLKELESL